MEYRKYHDTYYIRMDKGDEIIEKIYDVCKKEHIASAVYSGMQRSGDPDLHPGQRDVRNAGASRHAGAGLAQRKYHHR